MKTSIIQIGNSKGVILSADILRKLRLSLKSSVTIGYDDVHGSIIIKPTPRQGWATAAKKMRQSGDDDLLVNDVFSDENLDFWQWEEK